MTVGLGYSSHALSSCQCRRLRPAFAGDVGGCCISGFSGDGAHLPRRCADCRRQPVGGAVRPDQNTAGVHAGAHHRADLCGASGRGVAGRLARRVGAGAVCHRRGFPAVFRGRRVGMVLAAALGWLHRGIHSRGGAGGFSVPMGLEPPALGAACHAPGQRSVVHPGPDSIGPVPPGGCCHRVGLRRRLAVRPAAVHPGDLVKLVAASLVVPAGWALLDRFTVPPSNGTGFPLSRE